VGGGTYGEETEEGTAYFVCCLISASSRCRGCCRWRYLPSLQAPLLMSSWVLFGQGSVLGVWVEYSLGCQHRRTRFVLGRLGCEVQSEEEGQLTYDDWTSLACCVVGPLCRLWWPSSLWDFAIIGVGPSSCCMVCYSADIVVQLYQLNYYVIVATTPIAGQNS